TFKAYNSNPTTANAVASSSMVVDVVPYISKVTTPLSSIYTSTPSAFNRSASGVYPIGTGQTVTLTGYNLSTGSGTTVTIGGVSQTLTTQSSTSVSFKVASTTKSGSLVLNASTTPVAATNNSNINTANVVTSGGTTYYYDQQPNNLNNMNLTDDVAFDVWTFNTLFGTGTSQAIRYPTFKVSTDSTQRVGFAYDYGAQDFYVNDNGTPIMLDGSYTQWYDTAFAYDATPHFYAMGVNGDNGGGGTTNWANNGFYAWQAGNQTADSSGGGTGTGIGAYTTGTWKRFIENAYDGTSGVSDRDQYPKIAATGSGQIYMSYYDSGLNQLTFRYGTVAASNTFTGALGNEPNTGTCSYTGSQVIANSASTYGVGQYSAIGVTSTGVAVAAWYDQANQRLVYSYNTQPTSATSSSQWQTNATAIDSNFAGWYVDLAVDGNNGIHIAYYAAGTGDLKYAYIPAYNQAASATVVTVDSFLSVGSDIGITTYYNGTNYVPYISYYMPSFTQALGSVRVAWRTDFSTPATPTNGAVNDQYTGNWEVMTIPSSNIAQDYRVGIGIKTNLSGVNSPILGYSTKNGSLYNLETAQLQ
ncbi:MAG: hypothetical protein HKM05_03625, partial [Spirochaetales bacterium]|nr:hypothetical protein [Spirochaetales bacterium]